MHYSTIEQKAKGVNPAKGVPRGAGKKRKWSFLYLKSGRESPLYPV